MKARSYLFVLPQRENVFDKLSHWPKPDCYIIDLQDGCPKSSLVDARTNIRNHAEVLKLLDTKVLLRTNEINNAGEFKKDIELLGTGCMDGVILPYINDTGDIDHLDKCLQKVEKELGCEPGKLKIVPLIETVYSLMNIDSIIQASQRVSAIALGLYDMFLNLNAEMSNENINHVSNRVLFASKAAGLPFIDSPFINVNDYAGLFKDCQKSISVGADAKMVIHPDHVEVVNRIFSISKEEKNHLLKKIEGYEEGCCMTTSGEFIGPPIVEQIRRKLTKPEINETELKNGLSPKVLKYGLDLDTVHVNQVITCPYELTVDDSWRTIWTTLVSSGDMIETSSAFCERIGLRSRLFPFSAILNLTLCMAVEPYSESCLLHLGLEDVAYENPAYSGDTFRCYILIEELRNTSNNKNSVISSKHVLVNQNEERVLSFHRKTLFPPLADIESRSESVSESSNNELLGLLLRPIESQLHDGLKIKSEALIHPNRTITTSDLLLHDASRMISKSENLTFSTLFRNTHPIHFNYLRYTADEIVVCGGFVMAVVLANALKDFKQVVGQKIIHCSHINKISPEDTISSVSYIHETRIENGFEVLTIKTIGLRNVDAALMLKNRLWPKSLFSREDLRPAQMERTIKEDIPELFHKVCLQILWKAWRPTNISTGM